MVSSDVLFSLEVTNRTAEIRHPQGKRSLLILNHCNIKATRLKEYFIKRYTFFSDKDKNAIRSTILKYTKLHLFQEASEMLSYYF